MCPMAVHAQEIESCYIFSDFCSYWSYGYNDYHIYGSDNKNKLVSINTNLETATGKFLVIGEENDEENSSISYALQNKWDSYKDTLYTGSNIPKEIFFEYISSEDLDSHNLSGYDIIIIERIAKEDSISESSFTTLDHMVKDGQYIIFDSEITSGCVYTAETNGSVAVIDTYHQCLLISSNMEPKYFANLSPAQGNPNSITLALVANTNYLPAEGFRDAVKQIKILPTYNDSTLTNTFYTWYDVSEVFLPSCINSIGDDCFEGYSGLYSINLDHIKTIGNSSFDRCNFSQIIFPHSIQSIGASAFSYNKLSELIIPDSISSIGSFAFDSNPPLNSLTIHVNENDTSLGKEAFYVNSDTELNIIYDKEDSGNTQLFSPFAENDMEITALNFAQFIKDSFTLSFAGVDEDHSVEKFTVTFIDNKNPITTYTKEVRNGHAWSKYLEKLPNQQYSNLYLLFKGWAFEDGTIIDGQSTVNLDNDITIYSLYERKNESQTYTVNFPEYNKTIEIHYGDTLGQYDIPIPQEDEDTFLGWSQRRPINDAETENILTDQSRWWITSDNTIDLYSVWGSNLDKVTTAQTLSMIPNYYLNRNNTGHIYFYENGREKKYSLDCINFSETDVINSQTLFKKILNASNTASKICIIPNDYRLDIANAKKKGYHVIETNLNLSELKNALTLINCKYFQYLLVIQTPYVAKEESLNSCTGIGYGMTVTDWEIYDTSTFEGWVYSINTAKFMKYYNICNRVNTLADNLVNHAFHFNTNTTVTDAIKAINNYVIQYTAYDNPKKIYDLKWFLEETSKERNLQKEASHHGVCASYSKLAYAILGKCGYQTLPCAVWKSAESYDKYKKGDASNGPVHSINKMIINGKDYYCDFTWSSATDPMRYMFLTLKETNAISSHYHPVPDDYGTIISYQGNNIDDDFKGVKDKITITFNSNGGTPENKKKAHKKNKIIGTLPTVTKERYIFKGWYTKKSGGKKITTSTKLSSNTTLYAHWSKVTVKKAAIKSLSQKRRAVTVRFKKITDAEGYQIQYSTTNGFTKKTTKSSTVKGNKTFTKELTKLKNKTYYIRIRAYKTDSTKAKIYGKWSGIKKVKVK